MIVVRQHIVTCFVLRFAITFDSETYKTIDLITSNYKSLFSRGMHFRRNIFARHDGKIYFSDRILGIKLKAILFLQLIITTELGELDDLHICYTKRTFRGNFIDT